ncbi:hypothetical protein [Paraburkholderia sp.]|uniref:hypothetical protein n=1 Tax=Paraburkholderia sp. TaxID=1926495 RepID=UPI00286EF5E3|nr:hypothetical protein [Paraburkholderia sp.]
MMRLKRSGSIAFTACIFFRFLWAKARPAGISTGFDAYSARGSLAPSWIRESQIDANAIIQKGCGLRESLGKTARTRLARWSNLNARRGALELRVLNGKSFQLAECAA